MRMAFLVRIANFSDSPLHIKRNVLVAIARPAENYIVSPLDEFLLNIDKVTSISPLPVITSYSDTGNQGEDLSNFELLARSDEHMTQGETPSA